MRQDEKRTGPQAPALEINACMNAVLGGRGLPKRIVEIVICVGCGADTQDLLTDSHCQYVAAIKSNLGAIPQAFLYSFRSAVMGSTRAARSAGT
jgi:hypothetical protein